MRQVSFSYPARPECLVLNNVSLYLPSGDLTYIVGTSGSGKSTVGALLTKLYNPSGGVINLSKSQLSELSSSWIRQRIHYLPQSSVLFEETVGHNIALGKGDEWNKVKGEEIASACQKAMLQTVLFEDLPNGINTIVGERGAAVSGGQRQRIALARAILRDPEVLILDEATSALDYISRSLVNDAIRVVRQGKTTIIITHDISMINDMDFAYVLKDGQVVESGYKKDLMGLTTGHFCQMAKALERTPRESVPPTFSHPAPSRERIRQSDRLWMSNRATGFGEGVSIIPRPLTMSDGDLMMRSDMEEYWSCAAAGEATATNRRAGHRTRAQVLTTVSEQDRSTTSSSTTAEPVTKLIRKDHDALNEKDLKVAVAGETAGPLTIWQLLKTTYKVLSPRHTILMVFGFLAAVGNGCCNSRLRFHSVPAHGKSIRPESSTTVTRLWALAVLGVAAFDGLTTYLKIYLLESSAEKWVYGSRKEAIRRILKQDCEWFCGNEATSFNRRSETHQFRRRNETNRRSVSPEICSTRPPCLR